MKLSNKENFILKANKKHNFKYDYSLSVYKNSRSKLNIVCPLHGIFKQEANAHVKGQGCMECFQKNQKLTKQQFIQKANNIHDNKYDYSLVEYKNNKIKVKIICYDHGVFLQRPDMHIFDKNGCPECFSRTSKGQESLFFMIKNKYKKTKKEYKIVVDNKKYFADIFIPETNTIVEYFGDYWHCNPDVYNKKYILKQKKKTAESIWNKDEERKNKLKKLGYNVIIVWESNFKKNKEHILRQI